MPYHVVHCLGMFMLMLHSVSRVHANCIMAIPRTAGCVRQAVGIQTSTDFHTVCLHPEHGLLHHEGTLGLTRGHLHITGPEGLLIGRMSHTHRQVSTPTNVKLLG